MTVPYPDLTQKQREMVENLIKEARRYISSLSQSTDNLNVYIVGGAVRDALIGNEAHDFDFVVTDETVDSMTARGFKDIDASSFGVLHDENHEEWALTRTETKNADGYKGIEVDTEDVTLREDLNRRDLRMNAMAVHLRGDKPEEFDQEETIKFSVNGKTAIFLDPFDGRRDIINGQINHVGESFSEDPLRVLRVARYAARYKYTPPSPRVSETGDAKIRLTLDQETKQLMRKVAPELNRMSRDRIGEEVAKAMKQSVEPSRFWNVLRDVGALAVIAPKLDRASIVPAGPKQYHRERDLYSHTMMVLDEMHTICESRGVTGYDRVRRYMMAIAHDLGKVTIADKVGGLWSDDPPRRFGGHAKVGVNAASDLADRIGLEGHIKEAMKDAAEYHMAVHDLDTWEPSRLIKFVDNHSPDEQAKKPYVATVIELVDLAQADHKGRWRDRDTFDRPCEYTKSKEAPEDAVKPEFRRGRYMRSIYIARDAIENINGFKILRQGLCEDHSGAEILDEKLSEQLVECPNCRSPGSWVGEKIKEERYELVSSRT